MEENDAEKLKSRVRNVGAVPMTNVVKNQDIRCFHKSKKNGRNFFMCCKIISLQCYTKTWTISVNLRKIIVATDIVS